MFFYLKIFYVAATIKVIAMPDLHAPYHNEAAVKVVESFISDWRPHVRIALGDWVDGSTVSGYARDVALYDQLEEFEICNTLIDRLLPSETYPGSKRKSVNYYLEGNHEQRFRRFGNIPQDYRRLLDPRHWLALDKRRITWVPYSHFLSDILRIGDLSFIHGFAVNQYAAAKEASRFGNVVHGHTHRVMQYTLPHAMQKVTGYNIGCLCNLEQDYVQTRGPGSWQHAFGFGYIYKSGKFTWNIVTIKGDTVNIEGKEYKV